MNKAKELHVVQHMLDYCNDIIAIGNKFNNSIDKLESDILFKYSVSLCIIQIGELVTHLNDDFKINYSQISWRAIKSMRNIVTHNYGSLQNELVIETIKSDIPALKQFCETIIQQYEKEKSPATQKNVPSIDEDEPER